MNWSSIFEFIGGSVSAIAAIAGGWWAFENWRKRDEHFPRVEFEVTANFVGLQNCQIITEIVATLENKGVVPLEIEEFSFRLLGLDKSNALEKGGNAIRNQLNFPNALDEGWFVPKTWGGTFVYPGIRTEYNFVTSIPETVTFVRAQADFWYGESDRSHHAAKVLRVVVE